MLGQQVGYQGLLRRAARIGQDPDQGDNDKVQGLVIDKAHQQGREGAHHQSEYQHPLATKAVGQCAANHVADHTGKGKQEEQKTHFSHADAELHARPF